MSTKAQILANRNNSKNSTGPKTSEGKAVVSQNAVKHGLFAAEAVISVENPADYELYRDKYLAELVPVGMVESMLAERIVSLSWRLQRAERMHNEAIDVILARTETNAREKDMREDAGKAQDPRADSLEPLLGRAAYDDFSNSRVLERLLIYERRIEYSLISTINKLQNYQFIRQIREDETRKAKPARPSLRPNFEHPLIFSKGLAQYLRDKVAGRRRKAEKQVDLKKQSQFAPAEIYVNPSMKGDYENMSARGVEENKPNQSQFLASEQTRGVGKRKKSLAAANSLTG